MMRVLLDTNVILDSMLQRPAWHIEADAILQTGTLVVGNEYELSRGA